METYETRFISIGFSRYDIEKKTLSSFQCKDGKVVYTETVRERSCLSRCYSTENVRVTIYSLTPRVWKEELGIDEVHFFVQQPKQVD